MAVITAPTARAAELLPTTELAQALDLYLAQLNLTTDTDTREKYPSLYAAGQQITFDIDPGARKAGKFFRIVAVRQGRVESVHAFIERATGKVVKAAGWAAPAKSTAKATKGELLSRYTLADIEPLLAAVSVPSAQYGRYLYQS